MRSPRGAALAAALSAVLFAGAASAQSEVSLSLSEALARGARVGPEAILARREVVETAALREGAALVFQHNPVLSGYLGGFEDVSAPGFAWGAQLNQTFEVGGQRGARLREVDRRLAASSARARATIAVLLSGLVAAYAEAGAAHERVVFAGQSVAIADRLLAAARLRVQSGAGNELEVTLSEAERGRAGVALLSAERQERGALAALLGYLDLPPQTRLTLTTAVGRLDPMAPPSELVARARERRPDLAALRAERLTYAAVGERLAREAVPNPTLGAQVDFGVQQPPLVGLVFQLPLPVFQRNQGDRAVAAAREATLETAVSVLERRLEREVFAASAEFEGRAREAEVYERSILPAAVRSLDLVEAGWLAGRFDVFRVLTASRELTVVRGEYVSALEALWRAWSRLRAVTGEDAPR